MNNILRKKWAENDRIPSVREAAMQMEVNPNTVVRTYNYLQEKAIIFNKRGIGYFVNQDGYQKTREIKKNEFLTHDVPVFFKKMETLNLDITQVSEYYEQQKSE